jgi:uncharacterized membrane protein YjdF
MAVLRGDVLLLGAERVLRVHRVVGRHRHGQAATAFLATQGDIWDTQWDMFLAFISAILAQLLLSRWQDRQLASMRTG